MSVCAQASLPVFWVQHTYVVIANPAAFGAQGTQSLASTVAAVIGRHGTLKTAGG